jgi:hypothetical protein
MPTEGAHSSSSAGPSAAHEPSGQILQAVAPVAPSGPRPWATSGRWQPWQTPASAYRPGAHATQWSAAGPSGSLPRRAVGRLSRTVEQCRWWRCEGQRIAGQHLPGAQTRQTRPSAEKRPAGQARQACECWPLRSPIPPGRPAPGESRVGSLLGGALGKASVSTRLLWQQPFCCRRRKCARTRGGGDTEVVTSPPQRAKVP